MVPRGYIPMTLAIMKSGPSESKIQTLIYAQITAVIMTIPTNFSKYSHATNIISATHPLVTSVTVGIVDMNKDG